MYTWNRIQKLSNIEKKMSPRFIEIATKFHANSIVSFIFMWYPICVYPVYKRLKQSERNMRKYRTKVFK